MAQVSLLFYLFVLDGFFCCSVLFEAFIGGCIYFSFFTFYCHEKNELWIWAQEYLMAVLSSLLPKAFEKGMNLFITDATISLDILQNHSSLGYKLLLTEE